MMAETGVLPVEADQILRSMGHAVAVTDADGIVLYWNEASERLYGWSAEEAVGRPIASLTVPEMSQRDAAEIFRSLRDGTAWSGGFLVRHKDGSLFPALVSDSGLYRNGELVGIVGVSTNLGTALRPLLDRSPDAAVLLRSDAVVAYASPAAREIFGWPDSIVGTSVVPLLHPDERATLADALEEVVAKPGAHPPFELRVRSRDEWVWAEAALTNMLDDLVVRGVVCHLRLSTRRADLDAARERAAQLTTALESRVVIEQAKGFLACLDQITPQQAFDRLRGYARANRLPLHTVAAQVVDGTLRLPPR
jgi:PAS domain S-box-containing protein